MTTPIRILWKVPALDITWPSVRIRTYAPTLYLRNLGYEVTVLAAEPTERELTNSHAIILNKGLSQTDYIIAQKAHSLGVPVILDVCDDVTGSDRHNEAEALRQIAKLSHTIVTTGTYLRDQISAHLMTSQPIQIIEDYAEDKETTLRLVAMFPPASAKECRRVFGPSPVRRIANIMMGRNAPLDCHRKTVAWFGMPGRPGDGVGLETLLQVAPSLSALNRNTPLQLLVISRDYSRFRQITSTFDFPVIYREWALLPSFQLLEQADVCIVPNPPSHYAKSKSANRTLLALNSNVPVVATLIPAIESMKHFISTDDWHQGLEGYLSNPALTKSHLSTASSFINRRYSLPSIGESWRSLLTETAARSNSLKPFEYRKS